jgi:hypothetical protein
MGDGRGYLLKALIRVNARRSWRDNKDRCTRDAIDKLVHPEVESSAIGFGS